MAPMKAPFSRAALGLVVTAALGVILFYPKWSQPGPNATLTWDVFGYYLYLPAFLIHADADSLEFVQDVFTRYQPAGDFHHASPGPTGRYVLKYPVGMALVYLPAFAAAHFAAPALGYPADGFSTPYQLAILLECMLISLLGMAWLRRVLLLYFSDRVVAGIVLTLGLGSNWLIYASSQAAMTHGPLFAGYAGLMLLTTSWRQRPMAIKAALIGALVGWMAIIRPIDAAAGLIPLLWPGQQGLRTVWNQMLRHYPQVIGACLTGLAVAGIQAVYWKWAAGQWLFYSYGADGFSFSNPQVLNGLFSYRKGWLIYSPAMLLALAGMFFFPKNYRGVYIFAAAYSIIYLFVVFCWSNWWYGGGFGARALIQVYPLMAFGLGALLTRADRQRWTTALALTLALFGAGINFFFTWKAQTPGSGWEAEYTTRLYFLHTALKTSYDPADRKYLDLSHDFGFLPEERLIQAGMLSPSDTLSIGGEEDSVALSDLVAPRAFKGLRFKFEFMHRKDHWDRWQQPVFQVVHRRNGAITRKLTLRIPWNGPPHGWRQMEFDFRPRKGLHQGDLVQIGLLNQGATQPVWVAHAKAWYVRP